MSIPYRDFDINDLDTPKPWAPRETQAWKDVLDTMLADTLTGLKEVAGHKHNKIYSPVGVAGIEIGAAGDPQMLNLTIAGVVTNQATGSLGTVPVLPVSLGGTNSSAALNNDRVMVSNGGSVVESIITVAELELLDDMVSVSTGAGNNDKLVTQGYVDDLVATQDTFLELTDTPSDYTGNGGKLLAVNTTPDGVEFIANNSANWDAAYTHSQIAGGNSVHVSVIENTQWDAAYTHSQIAGGDSVHVSATENTQWDAAYTHSQVVTGNPHAVSYAQLGGNPADRITAGTNISWSGDTLNVSGVGSSTFVGLTDTPGSFTINRILYEGAAAVDDSANFIWDNANETLQLLNDDVSVANAILRFRKSRSGGALGSSDNIGEIVFEGYNGSGWDQYGKIQYANEPSSSPGAKYYVGTTPFLNAYSTLVGIFAAGTNPVWIKSTIGIGVNTTQPMQSIGGVVNDLTSTSRGIHINGATNNGLLVVEGTGASANGTYEGDGSARIILAMRNTPEAEHTLKGAEISYGGDYLSFRGVEGDMIPEANAMVINMASFTVALANGGEINEFSTDTTLAGNSDLAVPTEHAVKTYFDAAISGTWTDYSATSTVVGWASFASKYIFYKKIGKIMYVYFSIAGVSNANTASFTLPIQCANHGWRFNALGHNNSADIPNGISGYMNFVSNTTVSFQINQSYGWNATSWAASNNKKIIGQFWYQTV